MGNLKNIGNEELFILYELEKSEEVKKELALRYLYVVRSIAYSMRDIYCNFAELNEIINEGVLVLMSSIEKFNSDKNVKFETYITKRIRGMIIDLARKNDFISRTLRQKFKEIWQAERDFYADRGYSPTDMELADFLNISMEKLHLYRSKMHLSHIASLDMMEQEKGEFVSADTPHPEEHYLRNELRGSLVEGIKKLRDPEKLVISLYYEREMTMKEISYVMNLSEPRVSQIHKEAIKKLKEHITRKETKNISGIM